MIHIKFFIFRGNDSESVKKSWGHASLDFCQLTLGNQQCVSKKKLMLVAMTTSTKSTIVSSSVQC
jgi:hypothetical protein